MKISKVNPNFSPVTITLETKEEFNFLLGLLDGGVREEKGDCVNYCPNIDQQLFDLLDEYSGGYYD